MSPSGCVYAAILIILPEPCALLLLATIPSALRISCEKSIGKPMAEEKLLQIGLYEWVERRETAVIYPGRFDITGAIKPYGLDVKEHSSLK